MLVSLIGRRGYIKGKACVLVLVRATKSMKGIGAACVLVRATTPCRHLNKDRALGLALGLAAVVFKVFRGA